MTNYIIFLHKNPKFFLEEMPTQMKTKASGSRVNALFKQLMSVLTRVIIQQEKETDRVCIEMICFLQWYCTFFNYRSHCVHETDCYEKFNTGHNLPVVAESDKMHCSKS